MTPMLQAGPRPLMPFDVTATFSPAPVKSPGVSPSPSTDPTMSSWLSGRRFSSSKPEPPQLPPLPPLPPPPPEEDVIDVESSEEDEEGNQKSPKKGMTFVGQQIPFTQGKSFSISLIIDKCLIKK